MRSSAALRTELAAALRHGRNADGGWGYHAGKVSRLEPTCWGMLALGHDDGDPLRGWPVSDGLLLEQAGGEPNFAFHGLALLTLLHLRIEHGAGNGALVAATARVRGVALDDLGVNRQDNRLQAWSWIDGTFSWVEPTACCLLALKRARQAGLGVDGARISAAESLLYDRCCVSGGWNYGNSNMLGQELPAYVPTTALALLALQDRPAEPAVARSRTYLEREALSEPSVAALSLALITLGTLGRPVEHIELALQQQLKRTFALGRQHSLAMALVALRTVLGNAPFTL
jgi:hypothetical protein